jgi:MoaA/NifB/PqqE/SkfB family radical SAM enzyme
MSEALFRSIIAQAAPLTEEVCLHLMGEPLGHPKLSELVDICAEHGVPINLTSNGTLLDERRREICLRPIVRQVNFSLHSFEANFGEQDVSRYLGKLFEFTRVAFSGRPDL